MKPRASAIALPLLAAALAACGGGGSPATTAPGRVIAMGQQVTSTLLESDPRLNDTSVYHMWRFAGTAGQTVQIDMMSNDFDSYLILQNADGAMLARDDDGGDGLNAQIVFTLPSTAQYRIIANTYRQGSFGQYTLRVSAGNAAATTPSAVRGTITFGQLISGTLTANDSRLADNSVYHAYLFTGRRGQRITLEVMSDDFDAFAIIQDAAGNPLTQDDDSGEGLNARVVYTLPSSGTYRLIANAYREGAYGRYRIHVH